MPNQTKSPKGINWVIKLSETLPVIVIIITVISSGATFYAYKFSVEKPALASLTQKDVADLHAQIDQLDRDLMSVKNQLRALTNVPEDTKVAIQLKGIDDSLNDLKARHEKLENAISNNPAKAIEVPLLRKDLDNLKDSQQQNLLALKQGVDQVYDLNKWLLGAMAISIVTLAISNFLRGKGKEKQSESQS